MFLNVIKVPAHKIVLAAKSPYFRGMFSASFSERDLSVIELDKKRNNDMEQVRNAQKCFFFANHQVRSFEPGNLALKRDVYFLNTKCLTRVTKLEPSFKRPEV